MIDDPRLHDLLAAAPGPQEASDALVTEANRGGGLDNITVIVVRIDAVESTVPQPAR
jgi:protein phosphatase